MLCAVVMGMLQIINSNPAAASTAWSIVSSPNQPGVADEVFNAVSCASTTSCVAAGSYLDAALIHQTLIGSWNGHSWTIMPSPNQGTGNNVLNGVSCASATSCTAVGTSQSSGGATESLIESWNGHRWVVVPTVPALILLGVSCPAVTACTAVGAQNEQAAIESWNGTRWTLVPNVPHIPGLGTGLHSVSCSSAEACSAVGSDSSGRTLIERWNGTSWTIVSSPNLPDSNILWGVSCVSASACTAVGVGGTNVTLIEAWNGASWSIVPSPNQGSGNDFLASVSCASVTACTASGYYLPAGHPEQTLVESWNGTSWSIVSSPNEVTSSGLSGVSCMSRSACMAVGDYNTSGSANTTLAESWNGASWTIVPSPDHPIDDDALNAVSCISATSCTAVGSFVFTGSGAKHPLIESWNGTRWTTVPSTNDGTGATLDGVSCVSSNSCTAVGDYYNGTNDLTLVESWNGSAWSIVPSPNMANSSNFLNGVSCLSATSCMATGVYTAIGTGTYSTLTELWNGTSWSIVPSPNEGTRSNILGGVSCDTSSSCTAVGVSDNGSNYVTLVESWNGASWSIVPSPNVASSNSFLTGVSCPSASACTAVGYSGDGISTSQTLIESWNGASWSIAPSPNGATGLNSLVSVSCSANSCTSVGFDTTGGTARSTLVETWNGTAWSIEPSPNGGTSANALTGVSCIAAGSCIAVGFYSTRVAELTLTERYS